MLWFYGFYEGKVVHFTYTIQGNNLTIYSFEDVYRPNTIPKMFPWAILKRS